MSSIEVPTVSRVGNENRKRNGFPSYLCWNGANWTESELIKCRWGNNLGLINPIPVWKRGKWRRSFQLSSKRRVTNLPHVNRQWTWHWTAAKCVIRWSGRFDRSDIVSSYYHLGSDYSSWQPTTQNKSFVCLSGETNFVGNSIFICSLPKLMKINYYTCIN